MKKLVVLLSTLLCSCSHTMSKPSGPTYQKENFYPYHVEKNTSLPLHVYEISLHNKTANDLSLTNAVLAYLVDRTFLASEIFPEGSLYKKRVNHFVLFDGVESKNTVKAELTKSEKYGSYKLVIYTDAKGKQEASRQWLFPDDLPAEQLAIRIAKTIVKFSFQEL